MKIIELKRIYLNLTGKEISQSDIARALSITRATISKRIKTNSELSNKEINKIAEYFKIDPELLSAETYPEIAEAQDEDIQEFVNIYSKARELDPEAIEKLKIKINTLVEVAKRVKK